MDVEVAGRPSAVAPAAGLIRFEDFNKAGVGVRVQGSGCWISGLAPKDKDELSVFTDWPCRHPKPQTRNLKLHGAGPKTPNSILEALCGWGR